MLLLLSVLTVALPCVIFSSLTYCKLFRLYLFTVFTAVAFAVFADAFTLCALPVLITLSAFLVGSLWVVYSLQVES